MYQTTLTLRLFLILIITHLSSAITVAQNDEIDDFLQQFITHPENDSVVTDSVPSIIIENPLNKDEIIHVKKLIQDTITIKTQQNDQSIVSNTIQKNDSIPFEKSTSSKASISINTFSPNEVISESLTIFETPQSSQSNFDSILSYPDTLNLPILNKDHLFSHTASLLNNSINTISFSFKYRPNSKLKITHNQAYYKKYIAKKSGYFKTPYAYTYSFDSVQIDLDLIQEKLLIEKPTLAQYVWREIPEPHKILQKKWKREKSEKDELLGLIFTNVFTPISSLKVVKKQEKAWIYAGNEAIQLSQSHFENWIKGGQNSISLLSNLRMTAIYKKNKIEWENFLVHKIGIMSAEDERTKVNDDLVELNSKFGLKASKKWYYSALLNFKTQIFNGYDNNNEKLVSAFMAPAYLTTAIGMDFKEDKKFTLMLSPLTSKVTMVLDTIKIDASKYKIPDGMKIRNQTGGSIVSTLNWDVTSLITLESTLEVFKDYFITENDFQINWELLYNMRINRFLSTRINTNLRYFGNESTKLQFKEFFSIAFVYKF